MSSDARDDDPSGAGPAVAASPSRTSDESAGGAAAFVSTTLPIEVRAKLSHYCCPQTRRRAAPHSKQLGKQDHRGRGARTGCRCSCPWRCHAAAAVTFGCGCRGLPAPPSPPAAGERPACLPALLPKISARCRAARGGCSRPAAPCWLLLQLINRGCCAALPRPASRQCWRI